MPHANIWIRKENQEEWDKLVDKSDWVNWHLTEKRTKGVSEKSQPLSSPDLKRQQPTQNLRPSPKTMVISSSEVTPTKENPGQLKEVTPRDIGACEHWAGPRMCKEPKCKNYQFKKGV